MNGNTERFNLRCANPQYREERLCERVCDSMDTKGESVTNRERKELIRAQVLEGITGVQSYQECPNTFVTVIARVDSVPYRAFGFAKVSWPDTWDDQYEVKMATKKAIAKIVRAIIRDEPLQDLSEGLERDDVLGMFSDA